jgi:hypothetical protein
MSTDKYLPAAEQRRYKNAFDAIFRIAREEKVTALWKGAGPTVIRAMVVNGAQLASYSEAKERLVATKYFQEGM